MKREYAKPQIVFEDFSLTNCIASCEEQANSSDRNSCGLEFGPYTIFISSITGCNYTGNVVVDGDDGTYNGLCYHVPTEDYNLFAS